MDLTGGSVSVDGNVFAVSEICAIADLEIDREDIDDECR